MLFSEYDERYKGLFAKPLQRYYPTQKEEHHTQRSMRIQHLEATVRLHAGGGPLEGSGLPQKSTPLTVLEDSQPVLLSSVLTNATKRGQKELPCRGPPIAQATDHSEGTG